MNLIAHQKMNLIQFLKLGVRVFGGRRGQGKPYGRGETHPYFSVCSLHKCNEGARETGGLPPFSSEHDSLSLGRALYSLYALEGRGGVTLMIVNHLKTYTHEKKTRN